MLAKDLEKKLQKLLTGNKIGVSSKDRKLQQAKTIVSCSFNGKGCKSNTCKFADVSNMRKLNMLIRKAKKDCTGNFEIYAPFANRFGLGRVSGNWKTWLLKR